MSAIIKWVMRITLHRAVVLYIELINTDAIIQPYHMGVLLRSITKVVYTFNTVNNLIQQYVLMVVVRTRRDINVYVVGQFKRFNSRSPIQYF